MGIKRISTDKSVVFSYGQCGRPLVHGTNLSDAGQKSASRRSRIDLPEVFANRDYTVLKREYS
jgi:hypothetical protein